MESREHLVSVGKKNYPDTKLVWTMEENTQQQTGLPREFTFAFLMERRAPSTPSSHKLSSTPREKAKKHGLHLLEHPIRSNTPPVSANNADEQKRSHSSLIEHTTRKLLTHGESTPPASSDERGPISHDSALTDMPHGKPRGSSLERGIEEFKDEVIALIKPFRSDNLNDYTYADTSKSNTESRGDDDYDTVFMPLHFNIRVDPQISGLVVGPGFSLERSEETSVVAGEVGQRFPTDYETRALANECVDGEKEDLIDGLYNFAKMPGNFEDLIELPGSAVTTMVSGKRHVKWSGDSSKK